MVYFLDLRSGGLAELYRHSEALALTSGLTRGSEDILPMPLPTQTQDAQHHAHRRHHHGDYQSQPSPTWQCDSTQWLAELVLWRALQP